jgi:hypothetical protein
MIYYMNIFNVMAVNQNQFVDQDLNVKHVMMLTCAKTVSTQGYKI